MKETKCKKTMLEPDDYYTLADGRIVFTEQYHLKRGYCCASGCKHCPYDFSKVPEPKRTFLLKQKKENEKQQ